MNTPINFTFENIEELSEFNRLILDVQNTDVYKDLCNVIMGKIVTENTSQQIYELCYQLVSKQIYYYGCNFCIKCKECGIKVNQKHKCFKHESPFCQSCGQCKNCNSLIKFTYPGNYFTLENYCEVCENVSRYISNLIYSDIEKYFKSHVELSLTTS